VHMIADGGGGDDDGGGGDDDGGGGDDDGGGGGGGKGEGGEVAVPTPIGGDGGAPTMEPA